MMWTSEGRLFHILGPQAEKARLPNWVRVRFATAAMVCDFITAFLSTVTPPRQWTIIRVMMTVWKIVSL